MNYERLVLSPDAEGVDIVDRTFSKRIKGLYCDGTVALNDKLSSIEKTCVLAEELGHHHTTAGDIIDLTDAANRKQEHKARLWAYNKLIGLNGIVSAYKAGCRSAYDIAMHLDVTEEFLQEALSCYRQKYGVCTRVDNYVIYFEPSIGIFEQTGVLSKNFF